MGAGVSMELSTCTLVWNADCLFCCRLLRVVLHPPQQPLSTYRAHGFLILFCWICNTFWDIIHFSLKTTKWDSFYCNHHLTDEETKARRCQMTCLISHSWTWDFLAGQLSHWKARVHWKFCSPALSTIFQIVALGFSHISTPQGVCKNAASMVSILPSESESL